MGGDFRFSKLEMFKVGLDKNGGVFDIAIFWIFEPMCHFNEVIVQKDCKKLGGVL
jgi:hypothetical protein